MGDLFVAKTAIIMGDKKINPLDYEDPIAQIFAGEDINMDTFMETMGPDPNTRGRKLSKILLHRLHPSIS
jgi:hypothetical protein